MTTTCRPGPSDLGRRLAERRRQQGLTVEQLAAGAWMDPTYIEYPETAADPDPTRASLIRLAAVLGVSSREPRGPVAVPVNFRLLEGDIVFRAAPTTTIAARAGQRRVSFEVDRLDEALSEGWSVLVSGRDRLVRDPAELEELGRLGVRPWAGGERDCYYRLHPDDVTGRRIPAGAAAVGPLVSRCRCGPPPPCPWPTPWP